MIKSNNICKKISYSQKWDAQFCCSSLSFVIPLFHPVSVSFSLFPSLCLSSFLIFFVFCNEVLDSIFVVYSVASCIAESNLRVPRRHFDSAPPCLPLFQDSKKKEKNRLGSIWPSFLPLPSPPPPPLGRFGMGVTTLPVTMAIAKKSPFACHTVPPQLDWISTLSLVFPLLNDSVNRPTNESHWFLFKLQFVTFKQMSVTAHVIQLWCYRFQFVLVGGLILLITSS